MYAYSIIYSNNRFPIYIVIYIYIDNFFFNLVLFGVVFYLVNQKQMFYSLK